MAQPDNFGFGEEAALLQASARKFFTDKFPTSRLHALVAGDHRPERGSQCLWFEFVGEVRGESTQGAGAGAGRAPLSHHQKHLPAPQSALPGACEKHRATAGALRAGQPLHGAAAVGERRSGLSGAASR